MARYKITCRCTHCGHVWRRVTSKPDSPDPDCPNLACGETQTPIGMDLTLNKAPASIGNSISVKAIDETARIVMEDQGFTDLRSDVRPGETAAPKLAPQQQAMADAFFGGGASKRRRPGFNPGMHAAAAMRGSFSDPASTDSSLGAVHRARYRPPTKIVAAEND